MQSRKVYLYVFHTMSDWEYGYLIAELNSGRYFKKECAPFNVLTIGATKAPITTMGGLRIQPDYALDECTFKKDDVVILPGGETWLEPIHQTILEKIGEALNIGVIVAAICGATLGLANYGYLNDRKHTSNQLEFTKMVCPGYEGEKFHESEPVVCNENLITASGVVPLEFAKAVLEKLEVFAQDTLHAWYNLNKTHQTGYYFELMTSIDNNRTN